MALDRLATSLLAGRLPLKLNNKRYWLRGPTAQDRLDACLIYDDSYDEAVLDGLLTDDEALSLLELSGLWSADDERRFRQLPKDVENLKVTLWRQAASQPGRDATRKALAQSRQLFAELACRRARNAHLTASGCAGAARGRFLIGRCLLSASGNPVWAPDSFMDDRSSLLDEAAQMAAATRPTETDIRALARHDSWRAVWSCREVCSSVFACDATALSDEQRALIRWAKTYDAARECHEAPHEECIEDDDMFDGWMIERGRAQKAESSRKRIEGITSEKTSGAAEVFVFGAPPGEEESGLSEDDRLAVEEMNDGEARAVKHQRASFLKSRGAVHEAEMPDSKLRIAREFQDKMRASRNMT